MCDQRSDIPHACETSTTDHRTSTALLVKSVADLELFELGDEGLWRIIIQCRVPDGTTGGRTSMNLS